MLGFNLLMVSDPFYSFVLLFYSKGYCTALIVCANLQS
jgi:hypothetical protein